MLKNRRADYGAQLATAWMAALAAPLVLAVPAAAQLDSNQPYFDSAPAPRASKVRRNDSYQPTETSAGLGVLTSRSSDGAPASGVSGGPV